MRKIKFRVWDNVDYMSQPFTLGELQSGSIQFTSECPVMQFTGLSDSKGVEIYEGDIIGSKEGDVNLHYISHHKIVWHDSGLMGKQICSNSSYIGIDYWTQGHKGYVVIGNIYQNPELLRGATNGKG